MAKRVGVDKWIFFPTLLLVGVGLAMVFSASAVVAQEQYHTPYASVGRQAAWAIAGVLAMVVLMRVDYTRYNSPKFIYPALSAATLLLVMVFFVHGSHNTHRWIRFGSLFTFQPSEIAKPVLILFLAWFLHSRLDQIRDWKHTLLRAALIPLVFILLVVKQPDLGTALVLAGITALMLVLAGMEWKWLIARNRRFAAPAGHAALLGFVAAPAHAGLPASRFRSAGCWISHQPVADCRRHRRPHRPRFHGRDAEAFLPSRSFN